MFEFFGRASCKGLPLTIGELPMPFWCRVCGERTLRRSWNAVDVFDGPANGAKVGMNV